MAKFTYAAIRGAAFMQYPKRSQYKHAKKKKYRLRNWRSYTEALRRRGDLTVWFDVDAIEEWHADKTGKPGGQRKYADVAIETGLVVRMIYKLAYRQTQGLLKSLATLLGLGMRSPTTQRCADDRRRFAKTAGSEGCREPAHPFDDR